MSGVQIPFKQENEIRARRAGQNEATPSPSPGTLHHSPIPRIQNFGLIDLFSSRTHIRFPPAAATCRHLAPLPTVPHVSFLLLLHTSGREGASEPHYPGKQLAAPKLANLAPERDREGVGGVKELIAFPVIRESRGRVSGPALQNRWIKASRSRSFRLSSSL